MDPKRTNKLSEDPELLNQIPLHPELPGQHEPIEGRAGDHNVVWRPMQPVCGPSRVIICSEGWHRLQAALETTRSGLG